MRPPDFVTARWLTKTADEAEALRDTAIRENAELAKLDDDAILVDTEVSSWTEDGVEHHALDVTFKGKAQ